MAIDTQQFVGLEKLDALEIVKRFNLSYRITKRDGKSVPLTCDMNLNRINFEIEDNKVVKAAIG